MATPFTLRGLVGRLLVNTQFQPDGVESQNIRVGRYQELMANVALGANNLTLADEGSAFLVSNATPGTGLATIAAPTAFAATSPFLIVQNMELAGGKSLYLDYIRLVATAAGTGGTSLRATTVIDPVVSRYTSGATLQIGPVGTNTGGQISNPKATASAPSTVQVFAGPLVATAASANAKTLSPDLALRAAIPVALDSWVIKFGGVESAIGGAVLNGTAPSQFLVPHCPVILDPQSSFLLHLWLPAQSAASSYEVEVGGFLR